MQQQIEQFTNQTQQASQAAYDAWKQIAQTQFETWQQLANVQINVANQAFEAVNEHLQAVSKSKDYRELARAEADLVKNYGEKFVENGREVVKVVSNAQEAYTSQVEQSAKVARDTMKDAANTAKDAASEVADQAKGSASSSKKSA